MKIKVVLRDGKYGLSINDEFYTVKAAKCDEAGSLLRSIENKYNDAVAKNYRLEGKNAKTQ